MSPAFKAVLAMTLTTLVSCNPLAWVPGSSVSITPSDVGCTVDLYDHSTLFHVEMELSCERDGRDCYVIEQLSCGGVDKPDVVPIDLREAPNSCPGAAYCVATCEAGLGGVLWDTPALLEVDGCNVYDETS